MVPRHFTHVSGRSVLGSERTRKDERVTDDMDPGYKKLRRDLVLEHVRAPAAPARARSSMLWIPCEPHHVCNGGYTTAWSRNVKEWLTDAV